MATSSSAVCGIYRDRHSTEIAIEALRASGFHETGICALFPDQVGTKQFVRKKQTRLLQVLGAGAGALLSGAFGLSGEDGALLTTAHPLLMAFLRLGAGCALGSFMGRLAATQIPASEEHYEGRVRQGDILIAVRCDSPEWAKKAAVILSRTKATDVSSGSGFAMELVRPDRPTIRPASQKTVASPLRTMAEVGDEARKSAA